ncbi:hypothetical protein ACLGL1_03385 [Peptococcus simiae]|uniref:hypothetical protein n=1 Tax=Peptococcus simiae TaxID=1643805 RepID=UPI00398128D4
MRTVGKNVERWTLVLGLAALVVSFIFKEAWIGAFRPIGFTSLVICPVLGLVGLVGSIFHKNILFVFLNGLLALSFFLIMGLGYGLLG